MSACNTFTEHVWKPGECKNCFKPKSLHQLPPDSEKAPITHGSVKTNANHSNNHRLPFPHHGLLPPLTMQVTCCRGILPIGQSQPVPPDRQKLNQFCTLKAADEQLMQNLNVGYHLKASSAAGKLMRKKRRRKSERKGSWWAWTEQSSTCCRPLQSSAITGSQRQKESPVRSLLSSSCTGVTLTKATSVWIKARLGQTMEGQRTCCCGT